MIWRDVYEYSDYVFAEIFEGIEQNVEWTPDQIFMINTTEKYGLTNSLAKDERAEGRRLMVSRILETPLQEIKALSGLPSFIPDLADIPRYRLYSEHDF